MPRIIQLAFVLCCSSGIAAAQTPAPVFIDKLAPAGVHAAASAALLQRATKSKHVRVIAGLNLTLHAAHTLSAAQVAVQARGLRAMQDAVSTRALGGAAAGVTRFDYIPFVSMVVNAVQLRRLIDDDRVVNIKEDAPVPPTVQKNIQRINADEVWADGYPGKGIVVAILDTGVAKSHAMFAGGKVASEACYSSDVPGQSTSVCPGGVTESTAVDSGVNCPLSVDGCDHGTHVAGIAAGNMASPKLLGVAKGAKIVAVQVFSRFSESADCGALSTPCAMSWTSDQIKGLERVYALRDQFKIAAANLSLGNLALSGPCDEDNVGLTAIIDLLRSVRIATVIGSGNDGFDGLIDFPACISKAIAVGSTLANADTVSGFSNNHSLVRLMAPGSHITSAVPPGPATTATFSGTSMASAHVAGAFALLQDVNDGSTVDDIAAALECTGVPVTRADNIEPRIDVEAAEAYLLNPPNTTTTFNFDSAAEASSWTPLTGSLKVAHGLYRAKVAVGAVSSWTANCNESETITARMRRVDTSATGQNNSGFFFKSQISQTGATVSGYFAAFNIVGGGQVVLYRLDHWDFLRGTGGYGVPCYQNLPINVNAFNRLKVISQGGFHQLYINDTLVCTATDHAYGTGRVGVIADFPDPPTGHSFVVDSIVIEPTEVVPAAFAKERVIAASLGASRNKEAVPPPSTASGGRESGRQSNAGIRP